MAAGGGLMTGAEVARAKAMQKLALVPPDTDETGTAVDDTDEYGNQIESGEAYGLPPGRVVVPGSDDPSTQQRRAWHRCPDLVEAIMSRAREQWVALMLGDVEIVRSRPGGIVVIMGPTGAGKTSFVACLLISHARAGGVVIVLSRELPADELGARAIGVQCDAGWVEVLVGKVARQEMERALDLPTMIVLDRQHATLARLVEAIEAMRAEYPDAPMMVAIDYVQILESGERDTRAKVADIIAQIDEIARAHRVVVLAISQMSRAAARAARNGESMGADSTDGGAESAAIERAATVTLSIGSSGPEREDGTKAVDLSIGKGRMTGGDRVIPMSYCGRSGRWRVTGDARPAAEVKAERETARTERAVAAASLAITSLLAKASEPMSRRDIRSRIGGTDATIRRAVRFLIDDPESGVVEVEPRTRNAYPVWTRERATATARTIRETTGE
ncbi:MAG: AAA family ATPase [Myxococcota bacterium]|nr:AAA family ATPase [Myxococcota bacterium]